MRETDLTAAYRRLSATRLSWAFVAVGSLCVAGASHAQEPSAGPQDLAALSPRLVVAEPRVDLGRVDRGPEVSATFEIVNEGDDWLTIFEAKPS